MESPKYSVAPASSTRPFDDVDPADVASVRMFARLMATATPTVIALPETPAADPSALAMASVFEVARSVMTPELAMIVTPVGIVADAVVFVRLIATAAATEIGPD